MVARPSCCSSSSSLRSARSSSMPCQSVLTAASRRISCCTRSVCMSRYSRLSSASLASTADSLKLMSRCCSSSVSGISSVPCGVRRRKLQRGAQLELAHLARGVEAHHHLLALVLGQDVQDHLRLVAACAVVGSTCTVPADASVRRSSVRQREPVAGTAIVLKAKSGAWRSWKPQPARARVPRPAQEQRAALHQTTTLTRRPGTTITFLGVAPPRELGEGLAGQRELLDLGLVGAGGHAAPSRAACR